MARLDPAPTAQAAAGPEVVAGGHAGLRRGEVLLVLAGQPLNLRLGAAVRAASRQPDADHPVDPPGDRPPRSDAVGCAGLAARPSGVRAGPVLGERRGLALARPPQLLHPRDQLTDPGFEPLALAREPLDLAGEPVTVGPHCPALGLHHPQGAAD